MARLQLIAGACVIVGMNTLTLARWNGRLVMARRERTDYDQLSTFALWLVRHIERRGVTIQQVADAADMNVSQLHKIIKSYKPQYQQYQRPGVEKTVAIGALFSDVQGALKAAGYPSQADTSNQLREASGEYAGGEVVDFFNGLPTEKRRRALELLKVAFREDDDADDAGNIGRRAE